MAGLNEKPSVKSIVQKKVWVNAKIRLVFMLSNIQFNYLYSC